MHPQEAPLPRSTRAFIVLVALLQGIALYAAERASERAAWPFAALGGRVCWYTLVLTVPSMLLLSIHTLRDRRLWQHVALATAVFAGLAAWAAWSATGAPGLRSDQVLGPFGLTVAIGLLVALPWLQHRQAHGHWRAPYRDLYTHAWQNALTLALALLFVGICWMVLTLWAALFALVEIRFFRALFREHAFIYMATGIMVGLGILIGRTQQRSVAVLRQILFAICTGLLPLLAGVAVLFVLMLPFTGLQALWHTRSAATILLSIVLLMVFLANAVYQDGNVQPAYPRWLRHLVEAGLLALPLYAGLAGYAMWLRIDQYGWTGERFWGVMVAVLALLYALGYAGAVLRPQPGHWLPRVATTNVALSWLVIVLAMLVNTPLLDPYRIVVRSQMRLLAAADYQDPRQNLEFLRFDNGRRGHAAVRALLDDSGFNKDPLRVTQLQALLARTSRWGGGRSEAHLRQTRLRDPARIRAQLAIATGQSTPEAAWWSALAAGELDDGGCLQPGAECLVAHHGDLDGDGQPDVLLCDLSSAYSIVCRLHAGDAHHWRDAGALMLEPRNPGQDHAQLRDALVAGRLRPQPRRWPDLVLPGVARGSISNFSDDDDLDDAP